MPRFLPLPFLMIAVSPLFGAGEETSFKHETSKTYTAPTDPVVIGNLEKWRDRKFGFFIHWGAYSQWGIDASWSLSPEKDYWNKATGSHANPDPVAYRKSYEAMAKTFDPVRFDPEKWAAIAADAGTRYVVFTTKHHDGFCMWDTKTTDYRITGPEIAFHTNPKADVMKGVSDAFRKKGFMIGAYFSKPDWNTDFFWKHDGPVKTRFPNYDIQKDPERWKNFIDFTHRQIDELMTDYGRIDILWLDGGWIKPPRYDIDMPGIASAARKKQPGLLVVDRTAGGGYEDYLTPEGTSSMPRQFTPDPWEACTPLAVNGWAYDPKAVYRPVGEMLGYLIRANARNGALLLDLGPDANGELPPVAVERLRGMGAWLKVNGEAIYDTRSVAPYETDRLYFSRRANGDTFAVYLPQREKPAKPKKGAPAPKPLPPFPAGIPATITLPAQISAGIREITFLGASGKLAFSTDPVSNEITVQIPEALRKSPPCEHAWTLKLKR